MDFLPSGHVRTDPIISQTCLSDHVHTFYGANILPYPDITYEELIAVADDENTGNVVENKSLYWHPTVYKYDRNSKTYTRDVIGQSSSYYIWSNEDEPTKAFPNGFRMIAGTKGNTDTEFPNANAECVGQSSCERDDCYTENDFFPKQACAELEVSMFFPGCWDGVNLDSEDHMSHVAYTEDGEVEGDCPSTHPVRIPVISFFFRIFDYDGGWHTFSDGSSTYHSDYVSGWDEDFLQSVLDDCENDSLAAMPNGFCDDFITYHDGPKCSDDDCDFTDPNLLKKLKKIQPKKKSFKTLISPEETSTVQDDLPRGTCTGTLFSRDEESCDDDSKYKFNGRKKNNCGWAYKKNKKHCKKVDKSGEKVKNKCPIACKNEENCTIPKCVENWEPKKGDFNCASISEMEEQKKRIKACATIGTNKLFGYEACEECGRCSS